MGWIVLCLKSITFVVYQNYYGMDCIMFKEYRIRCIQKLLWYGLHYV